jgi:hypothetical protein
VQSVFPECLAGGDCWKEPQISFIFIAAYLDPLFARASSGPPSFATFSFATFSAGMIWKLGAEVTKESLYRDLCAYIRSTKSDHALIPNEFDLYDMWKDASLGRVRYGLEMSTNLGSLGLRILEKTPCAASVERAQSVQTDVITKKKFQISNELAEARIALRANAPGRNKRLEKRSRKVKDRFEATEYGLVKDGGGD